MSANSNLAMEYSMGVGGGRLVQDTSAYTGNFVALTFLAPNSFHISNPALLL